MTYKLNIDTGTSLGEAVLEYVASFSNIRTFSTNGLRKTVTGKRKADLQIGIGVYEVEFMDRKVTVDYKQEGDPVGIYGMATYYTSLMIGIEEDDATESSHVVERELLEQFINAAVDFCDKDEPKYVTIKVLTNGIWRNLSKLPKRNIDTIYLDKGEKEKVMNDIRKYVDSEEVYKTFGIPYKRNYLLAGPPGTGKTSLIFAIASMLGLNVAIVNFGPKVDDATFMTAIAHLPEKHILLLEDIDSLFVKRTQTDGYNIISFSGILNALDGMGRKHNLITFMTTNHPERLDPALLRPGRVDMQVNFKHASEEQIRMMVEKFLPTQVEHVAIIVKKAIALKCTTAVLQKFFFDHREVDDITKHLDALKAAATQDSTESGVVDHMYN